MRSQLNAYRGNSDAFIMLVRSCSMTKLCIIMFSNGSVSLTLLKNIVFNTIDVYFYNFIIIINAKYRFTLQSCSLLFNILTT